MATMNAVQIHMYGGAEVLGVEAVPLPTLAAGQVLVNVYAAGVNPVDWKTREGHGVAGMLGENPFPMSLGWDISGVVTEVAPDVTQFAVGDEVYGMVGFPGRGNAYTDYVAANANELAHKPKSLNHGAAGALPLAVLTAWQALFNIADLQAGQRVLVHAGAGGVGHLAVQLAKWKGAHVIATASARNAEWVRSLGAAEVVDYTATPFESAISDIDVVLDAVGGEVLARSVAVVKSGGILVSIVDSLDDADSDTAAAEGVRFARHLVHPDAPALTEIAALVDGGELQVEVGSVFPFAEVRHAHDLSQGRHARGKIVLTLRD